jgi:hypothetical protein
MKITLKSIADLRDYFGREPVVLDLPEGATLQQVVEAIAARWGKALPAYMWDGARPGFRGPILLLVDKKVQQDFSVALQDGQEVIVMKALAGG